MRRRSEALPAILLLLPFTAAFLLFFVVPTLQTFYLSLTESSLTRTSAFVGLANYATLVQDPSYWSSLGNTFYFALLTVVPLTVLGLVMALLVDHFSRAGAWLQGAFFLPYVLPISVMTLIAEWTMNPSAGLVKHLLGFSRAWFADLHWAMPTVAIFTVWWTVGFNMLMFLAGLRNIPRELYEAAALDGARGFATFRHITWPALKPVTVTALVLQLIASLKVFGQTYLLTTGGPFNTTRVTLHYMYETAFTQSDAGYAAAVAMAFMAVVVALSLVQAWLVKAFKVGAK
ncbi:multiple sugar transport system permease protein [Pseudoduganella flava]|uniref:ABC transporter permease subunit n=1 Tax=Pseudoduganella flava TaxID=871742 RepID=A0A562PBQ6_9BURK|nr:sugar ABC transporter permease [Pseudoduganella flava]QGZ38016.1 ABC transporter permease subunit [Pseudoduganella flava]TWI41841.1 multiple sugar transport system permease protein [Pseudoduganella flava]